MLLSFVYVCAVIQQVRVEQTANARITERSHAYATSEDLPICLQATIKTTSLATDVIAHVAHQAAEEVVVAVEITILSDT